MSDPQPTCLGAGHDPMRKLPVLARTRPGASFAVPPRTLLLVEDSRFAAETVRLICRRASIRLRRAETLQQATRHLRVYRPDIVLIDLGLPDGSGLDLIAALAQGDPRPARLLAVSGDPMQERRARLAGADDFLLKPLNFNAHLAALTGRDLGEIVAPDGSADRNSGADPLALRDDLRLLRDLLETDPDGPRLRYAGEFLASVGWALQDPALAEAARSAGQRGDRQVLVTLTEERVRQMPTF